MNIAMCRYYSYQGKPVCIKGHKASLRCHTEYKACEDYEPSKSSAWETEEVSPRNKLLWFIVQRVKQGATEEQLLKEVPDYIAENHLPEFTEPDIKGMVSWAIRKFPLPDNE